MRNTPPATGRTERMAVKPNKLQNASVVFTANRLLDGKVIWLEALSPAPVWGENIAAALVISGGDMAQAEAAGAAGEAAQFLVGPYAVAVDVTSAGVVPQKVREQIRVTGPSAGSSLPRQAA
jgi:hypothetical protein